MYIGKPYICEERINDNEYYSLCSDIHFENHISKLFFRVEAKYKEYICFENADAFLVALFPLAIFTGENIVSEAPISERLYYFLTTTYIPTLANSNNEYKKFCIDAETTNADFGGKATGTGISCGVDSFYTILSNLNNDKTYDYNLTHLTFFNVGACGLWGGDEARKNFYVKTSEYSKIAKSMGLEFVSVDSNISEFLMMDFNATVTFRNLAAVLSLEKLFKNYYFSAGVKNDEFSIDSAICQYFDLFSCQALSTESTFFLSFGGAVSRIEKVDFISNFDITFSNLNVCNHSGIKNCSCYCMKCLRTEAELYSLGKLQLYSESFDVQTFNKKKALFFSKLISIIPYDYSEALYLKECREKGRISGNRIPFISYIIAIPGLLKFTVMSILRRIKPLRRFVHKRLNKRSGIRFSDVQR